MQKPTVFKGNNKTYNPPDWNKVAQSVGRPTRNNCGTCHFYGGGGDGVKHGDIDSSLAKPNKALDVHMGTDGQNFDCIRCHSTTLHKIAREEERILAGLTAGVRKVRKELAENQAVLAHLDLRQAIARLTVEMDAIVPELTEKPCLGLLGARHPLLVAAKLVDSDAPSPVPVDAPSTNSRLPALTLSV